MRSERWLTRRAARGDREAFAAIFSRHQQDLYRYCVAILGDPDDAQDALQNTMVKALRALPGECREIALKPWLFRIAHNEAIELRRRERPAVPLADVELPAGASLEEVAAERWRLRELLADLDTLPLRQRGALVMRELAGFDFEQIAIALETTPAAARQVLYEARRGLREMAEGHEMRCDVVTAILSDGDGRVSRRRDLRAHLRDCPDCRAFAEEIRSRGETLAAIAPLPALAAAAMVKGALAAGGGAAAAGTGAGGGAGAAGVAAGAAAKAGSTAAIVKSAIGVVAIAAVGAVAADQSHLVHLGGSGGETPAAHSSGAAESEGASTPGARESGDQSLRVSEARVSFDRRRDRVGARPAARGGGPAERGTGRDDRAAASPDLVTTDRSAELVAATSGTDKSASNGRQARGTDNSASAAGTVHPQHPAHPSHRAHPTHPDHPAHPGHAAHADAGGGPVKGEEATAGSAGSEHGKASVPSTTPAAANDKADPPPAATPAAEPAPTEAPPGQVRKEAREEEAAG